MTPTLAPDTTPAATPPDFDQVYRDHFATIYRYVWRRTFDQSLAEEITAETFTRAWRRLDGFTPDRGGMPAWLTTIARNLINDHYGSSRAKREVVHGPTVDTRVDRDPDLIIPAAEDTATTGITAEAVRAAVQRLGDLQRECIIARFLEELSVAETATRLGRKEGAIKTLTSRAVATLARDLILIGALTT